MTSGATPTAPRDCSSAIRATSRATSCASKATARSCSGPASQDDNAALTVDMTNPDVRPGVAGDMPRDVIALERTTFLWKGALYDRVGMRNYDSQARAFGLDFRFDADFHDLFEARGTRRAHHGTRTSRVARPDTVEFSLSRPRRRRALHPPHVRARARPPHRRPGFVPRGAGAGRAPLDHRHDLLSRGRACATASTSCVPCGTCGGTCASGRPAAPPRPPPTSSSTRCCVRARADLDMLTTSTAIGHLSLCRHPLVLSTVFGRDGIITAHA